MLYFFSSLYCSFYNIKYEKWLIFDSSYFENDPPYVVGRIHEAHRSPTKFDNAGKLPDTKKLAEIKSKEY